MNATHTRSLWIAGLIALATVPVSAEENAPTALSLLRQAVAAHAKPGPMTIVTTMTGPADGRKLRVTTTIRRNDSTHFQASAAMEMGPMKFDDGILQWYRNGKDKVFYDGTENACHRGFAPSPFPPDLIGDLLAEIDKDLKGDPVGVDSADFQKGIVTAATHEGLPVWRIRIPEDNNAEENGSDSGELLIGKDDLLVRKIRFTDEDGTFEFLSTYERASAPFGAETFAFTPPSGARWIAAPAKPALKPVPKKAPSKKSAPAKAPARKAPAKKTAPR